MTILGPERIDDHRCEHCGCLSVVFFPDDGEERCLLCSRVRASYTRSWGLELPTIGYDVADAAIQSS